jgi:hypothetical protein
MPRYRLRTLLIAMAVVPPVIAFFALRPGILVILLCFYPLVIVAILAAINVAQRIREKWMEHQEHVAGKRRRAEAAYTPPKAPR